jgi:hypothetical protein
MQRQQPSAIAYFGNNVFSLPSVERSLTEFWLPIRSSGNGTSSVYVGNSAALDSIHQPHPAVLMEGNFLPSLLPIVPFQSFLPSADVMHNYASEEASFADNL